MGKDINTYIIDKKGDILVKNLYDGRNYEFFDNLVGQGIDREYDFLPTEYGIPDFAPSIQEEYDKGYCFDARYISVKAYKDWYDTYKPQLKGGYLTRYEIFLLEEKNIIPDWEEVPTTIMEEDKIGYSFRTWIDDYDQATIFYDAMKELPDDAILIYFFDS